MSESRSQTEPRSISQQDKPSLLWLKLVMAVGISLILIGHYLWVIEKLPETMGVPGILWVAGCCALGLILSLPTKIYLTLLLMQHESEQKQAQLQDDRSKAGNSVKQETV